MKKEQQIITGVLAVLVALTSMPAGAAELLDVKPTVAGGSVSVEVTADIPMTYTYYKVPGEARAVVDIADADPEKVEPLLVVNKGAVSSISVDKAMIASMTVSRLVFNLVSESDIHVVAAPDRKALTVTFGNKGSEAAVTVAAITATPSPVDEKVNEKPVTQPSAKPEKEEDPLGLDEPQAVASSAASPKASAQVAADVPAAVAATKLVPVVPDVTAVSSRESAVVTGVLVGDTMVEIQSKTAVGDYKTMILDNPVRLVIDIPGTKGTSVSSFPIKKFGIEKVRIASNGTNVRVVFDARSGKLPSYKIAKSGKGLLVTFK